MKRLHITLIFFCLALVCSAESLDEQLWKAIIDGNESLALELLQQGADINSLDNDGLALMHRYASADNEFMLNWLYEHGADVNVKDFEGSTPIFYATYKAHYRRVYQLITMGADVNVVNQYGLSLQSMAEQVGAKLYIELFANPKSYITSPTTDELFAERQQVIRKGEWDKAIALAKQEIKQAPKEWEKTSPYFTRGISDLGMIYTQLGRTKEAEKYFLKALNYWKKLLPSSEQYFNSVTTLAFLYREMNRYEEALALYNECADHIESISNPQVLWQIYSNRAMVYAQLANYDAAESDYQKAIILTEQLPEIIQKQGWCITMGNYAMMNYYKGTPESLKKYEELLYEVLGVIEENHFYDQNYIRFKQQFCIYEESFGSIALAEEGVKELLVATKTLLGNQHEDYLIALNIASEIAFKQNQYAQTYAYLTEALDLIKQRKNTRPTQAEMAIIGHWAELVDLILEDSTALWAHQYAYEQARKIFGEKSVYYLQQVGNFGVFWSDLKQYERALPYQHEAYQKSKELYGDNNVNTLIKGNNLWQTYAAIPSKRDSAYHYLKECDLHTRSYIQNMFGIMSEQQREEFWKEYFSSQYSITQPSFLADYATINPLAYGNMYNNVLFTRGLLLNSSDAFSRIIANTKDSVLQNKWQQLLAIKSNLNSSQFISSEDRRTLEKKKDKLEREIMLASDEYRLAQENFTTRWQDVQNALKEDEIAIEFTINCIAHWGYIDNKTDSVMYYALVLRKGDEHPQLIPLFERDELGQFYHNGHNNRMYLYEFHQDAAYNLVWKKIIPYLQNCKTIYFAPTHALAQMALEALPVTKDSVFGDYYNLYRLTSTREVLKVNNPNTPINATLFGGIEYDVSPEDMLAESERYADISISMNRSAEPLDTINRGKIIYLPGTKREVEQIQRELNGTNCHSTVLMGSAANEESFVVMSGQHNNIIHLATHGFFWREDVAREKDAFKQHEQQETIDPLSRCGLLFAGANMAYQGHADQLPEGVQDGILTAREISTMDLSGCDLAVLSACETGVGEYSEDGTIGLQRAFKQAGVQTIIMSLWPVSDAATQLLMTEFYRNWITLHQSKREAFRNAQNTVRTYRDEQGFLLFEEPVYWAGFIMLD